MDHANTILWKPKTACSLSGTLMHPDGEVPFNGSHIKLIKRKAHGYHKLVAETVTGIDGCFTFAAFNASIKPKTRKMYAIEVWEEGITPDIAEKKVNTVFFDVKARALMKAGILKAEMYEAETLTTGLSIELESKEGNKNPQEFTHEQIFHIIKSAAPNAAKSLLLKTLNTLNLASTHKVQALFGKPHPQDQLNAALITEMIINWAGSDRMYQDQNNLDKFYYPLVWDGIEVKPNTTIDCPNAWITFIRQNGTLHMAEYTFEKKSGEPVTYKLGESLFNKYLYLIASGCIYDVEADVHLQEHLKNGLRALCTLGPINDHIVRKLIFPCFQGDLPINDAGKTLIFGDGVLSEGKFTPNGVNQRLKKLQAASDWTEKPIKPLASNDLLAQARCDYWDSIITPTVSEFFEEFKAETSKNWEEIYYVSKNNVLKSLEFCPLQDPRGPKGEPLGKRLSPQDNSTDGRIKKNGKFKALRPITLSKTKPAEGDMIRLQQYCSDCIMGSFNHFVAHDGQRRWVTNFEDIGSLAPNHFEENPNQPCGGTLPATAIKQATVVHTLVNYKGRPLVQDPNVYPPLRKRVEEAAPRFLEKYGIDLNRMWAGIPI